MFLVASGVTRGSRVANLFGYGAFPPAHFYEAALLELGCDVIPAGSGRNMNLERKIAWLQTEEPACVLGVPTYIVRVVEHLRAAGYNQALHAVVGGEVLHAPIRARLAAADVTVSDHYGMLEAPMIAGQFACGHLHLSDDYDAEVLNDDTISATGSGELLLSSSKAWEIPMARLRTGDDVQLTKTCTEHSSAASLSIYGRRDNLQKIGGTLVSLSSLDAALAAAGLLDYFLALHLTDRGHEQLTLTYAGEADEETLRRVLANITDVPVTTKREMRVTPPLTDTGKPRRFVDRRHE
jgi:phenylacetate-coenzyme A ligase PaaK-like adenylate-forming protein